MPFAPAPDRVVGSKYRLVRRIAGGGMGSVWSARHLTLDVEVAVKLMSPLIADTPTALSRFEREAKASAQLKSRNIVKVTDYGVEDGTPFMVMELLEGEDLGHRLARVGKMPLADLSPVFTEICRGLKVAHDAGIVHRDLKPSNVFLAREGDEEIVKLCDFGVARETKTQLVDEKTSSGVVVGSPHHMSPEQAMAAPVDHRSDLWALGVLVYRALTGGKPFDGEALAAVMLAVVSKPVPKITQVAPELPADLDRFIERALCRDVDRRFQSATAMAEALRAIAEGKDATALLAEPDGSTPRGRDEATLPEGVLPPPSVGAQSSVTPASEATASRELRAVTAGVSAVRPGRSGVARLAPWLAAVAVVGGLGFYFGRSGAQAPVAATQTEPSSSLAPASNFQPAVVPLGAPSGAAPAVGTTAASSATAYPSTAVSASASAPRPPAARPAPVRSPTAPKRIDDFTGLPTP